MEIIRKGLKSFLYAFKLIIGLEHRDCRIEKPYVIICIINQPTAWPILTTMEILFE